jgi:4-carboxymuconolactone decarboxylase
MSCLIPFALTMGFAVALAGPTRAQDESSKAAPAAKAAGDTDKAILSLSKDKWLWMADRKVDALEALFHKEAVFVHMGGSMTRAQELAVIKSGNIQYKKADIQEASVRVIGSTAIVLNRIRLLAVVGGNEVTNPFMVTEVYVQQDGKWILAQLSFTRLLGS